MHEQFPLTIKEDIDKIASRLKNFLKYQYRSTLLAAGDMNANVHGFAPLLYFPGCNFCYLYFKSAARFQTGRGIGGALYERVRDEACALNSLGIFME